MWRLVCTTASALVLLLSGASAALAAPIRDYDFDTGTAPQVIDSGSDAKNGTLKGVAGYSTDTPSGSGRSADLGGDADADIEIPTVSYQSTTALTIEAWIRPDALASNDSNLVFDNHFSQGQILNILETTTPGTFAFHFTVSTSDAQKTLAGGVATIGAWQHLAGVYDGSTMQIFVNGVSVASVAHTGQVLDSGSTVAAIGGRENADNGLFDGRVDDFRIHLSALTADQLADGAFAPVPEPATAMLAVATVAVLARRRR